MSKETYFSLALGFVAIAWAAVQGMYPLTPPSIGWPIVGIFGISAIVLFFRGVRKHEQAKDIQGAEKGKPSNDLWQMYHKINDLIRELRGIAPVVNKDNEGKPDRQFRIFFDDQRVKEVLTAIEIAMQVCTDQELCDLFGKLINYELHCAQFSINPIADRHFGQYENFHQRIRDRIRKLSKRGR